MPTYGRRSVQRAIESVLSQSINNIELIVVVDPWRFYGDPTSLSRDPRTRVVKPVLEQCPKYLPGRIALLRNYGIQLAEGKYIAHLDDDNWWSSEHLQTLCEILDAHEEYGFAYSWRTLVDEMGNPFFLDNYPWSTRFNNNLEIFERFVELGLVEPGKPYLRDCMVSMNGEEILSVDTSEFCVRREVHDQIPFHVEFSVHEMVAGLGDDDMLCKALYYNRILSGCSQEYSLYYQIGGYSNTDNENLLGKSQT
jgi:glycosyltransferase involved in cell wall biosynthesis